MKSSDVSKDVMHRREKLFVVVLFFLFTLLGLLFTNFPTWNWPGGDGRDYANITEALVEGGSFDLRHSSYPLRRQDDPTVLHADDGSLYSIFPMGRALAQAPFFALGRWLGEATTSRLDKVLIDNLAFSVTTAVLYGLSACFLFLLLSRYLLFSFPLACLGTLFYCLATLAFPFSKIHGVESLQIVLFMCMVYFGLHPGRWSLAVVSLSFGWLVVTKPPSAVALPILVYLFFRSKLWFRAHWPSRILAALGTIAFASLFFYYNWLRSGDPSASYAVGHAADTQFFLAKIPQTLWPLFFGPERNLFLNNPILFLALPGLLLLKNRTYLITALGLWVTMLLLYGSSGNTNWGAYVGNGRYAVPFIFLLIPFVLATLRYLGDLKAPAIRTLSYLCVAGLFLVSFYVQILYASFTEFHVKQYELTYNRYAAEFDMPLIQQAVHQLQFAHTLYWSTDSCQHPSGMDVFLYPSEEPKQAAFAARVLKVFPARFFCKDYLFLNRDALATVSWLAVVGYGVLVAFTLSLLFSYLLVRGGVWRNPQKTPVLASG